MEDAGLDVYEQAFNCPRGVSWTRALYYLLGAAAAAILYFLPSFVAFAVVFAVVAFILIVLDLLDKNPFFSVLSKGKSQNVVAKYVPHASYDKRRKIIIVAHYDSTRNKVLTMHSIVRYYAIIRHVMRVSLIALVIITLISLIPLPSIVHMVIVIIGLICGAIALIAMICEIAGMFMPHNQGANCNASGVAVMQEVAYRLNGKSVPSSNVANKDADKEPEGASLADDAAAIASDEDVDDGAGAPEDDAAVLDVDAEPHGNEPSSRFSVRRRQPGREARPRGGRQPRGERQSRDAGHTGDSGHANDVDALPHTAYTHDIDDAGRIHVREAADQADAAFASATQAQTAAPQNAEAQAAREAAMAEPAVRQRGAVAPVQASAQAQASGQEPVQQTAQSAARNNPRVHARASVAESQRRAAELREQINQNQVLMSENPLKRMAAQPVPEWAIKAKEKAAKKKAQRPGDADGAEDVASVRSQFADVPFGSNSAVSESEPIVEAVPATDTALDDAALGSDDSLSAEAGQAKASDATGHADKTDAEEKGTGVGLDDNVGTTAAQGEGLSKTKQGRKLVEHAQRLVSSDPSRSLITRAEQQVDDKRKQTSDGADVDKTSVIPLVTAAALANDELTAGEDGTAVAEGENHADDVSAVNATDDVNDVAAHEDEPLRPARLHLVRHDEDEPPAAPRVSNAKASSKTVEQRAVHPEPTPDTPSLNADFTGIDKQAFSVLQNKHGGKPAIVPTESANMGGKHKAAGLKAKQTAKPAHAAASHAATAAASVASHSAVPSTAASAPVAHATTPPPLTTSVPNNNAPINDSLANLPKLGDTGTIIVQQAALDDDFVSRDELLPQDNSVVNATGAFVPLGATGTMKPISDELLAQAKSMDDIYVEDADDSAVMSSVQADAYAPAAETVEMPESRAHSFFDSIGDKLHGVRKGKKKKHDSLEDSPASWLGVDEDFDARSEGGEIGSWDNFSEDDENWSGGAYGGNSPEEDEEALYNLSAELIDKEVWLVALGADSNAHAGLKAFLREHVSDMRGAMLINVEAVGAGDLYFTVSEGSFRPSNTDHRLQNLAASAGRATSVDIKPKRFSGYATDAAYALRRGVRSISIMGLDNNIPAAYNSSADTRDIIDEDQMQGVADLIIEMIKSS
jgi:hypothetical protein